MAKNIKALCSARKLTFAELERATGLGNGVIARWERSSPRVDSVQKVADYFGVTVDELLEDAGQSAWTPSDNIHPDGRGDEYERK